MYSRLSIQRFRCFSELNISGLKRVNLITGVNNAGKTSLLEALFLLIGGFNPTLPIRVNSLRGIDVVVPSPEEQWGWLFHNHETTEDIRITASDSDGGEDTLRIHLGTPEEFERITKGQQQLPIDVSETGPSVSKGTAVPSTLVGVEASDLILEFHEHRGRLVVSRARLSSDGRIRLEQPKQNGFRQGAFLATRVRPASEDTDRLSRLKRQKRDGQVVRALRAIEPDLEDLVILVLGGESIIHAEVKGIGLIPIPLLGEGVGRLLSLTLALLTTPGGLILVDEIENGIHHSALRGVWKGLATAAEAAQAQLVATTHSQECIAAAHAAFLQRPEYDLSITQLFRLPDGIKARTAGQDLVDAAIDNDIDLR